MPSFVARSTSASLSNNSRAASTWPFWQATNSGVPPSFIRAINICSFVQQQPRRVDVAVLANAMISGVAPFLSA